MRTSSPSSKLRSSKSRVLAAVVVMGVASFGDHAVQSAGGPEADHRGSRSAESTSATDAELTIANISPATSFDPLLSTAGRRLEYLWPVYDALIRIGQDGNPEPGLATSWEYNEDNTAFTLTLREGVTFTDGTPLDAEAVKANFDRALEVSGPNTSQFQLVDSTEVVDPLTVRINLSAPNPALPVILSQNLGMMVSPEAFENEDLGLNPVGAGAYTLDLDATVADDHYTYVRNPDYYDPDAYPFGTVTIRVIADFAAILQSLQSGDIDAGEGNAAVADAASGAGFEVLTQPTDTAGVMLLDRAGEMVPALGDVRVRQALNHAVDRAAVVEEIVLGYGTPTSQFISPGMEGYDPALDDFYPYDPDRARELLEEAGYGDGFTLPILSSSASATVVQAVAGFLGDVGVEVEVVIAGPEGLSADIFTGQHPATYLPWGMTNTYLDSQFLLVPGGSYNPLGSSDDEMTALIDEGSAQSPDDRDATYQALSRRIVEEAWFLPLYVAESVYMAGPDLQNVTLTPNVITPDFRGWQPA